jgi:hypothetical protein
VTSKANWSQTHSLSATCLWSLNTTLSNPLIDVATATTVIAQASGKKPNVIEMNFGAFVAVKGHVSILDRTKYTSADSISEQMIARLFDLEKVLVGAAIQNESSEGMAASNAFLWTDTAFIGYIESAPGLKKVSALWTFRSAQMGNPWTVKKWREEKRAGDMIEVGTMYQHVTPASACGYVICNTL